MGRDEMAPGAGQEVCEGQHGAERSSRTSCLLWLHRHLPHLWDSELNVKNDCKAQSRERTHVWTEGRLERESGIGRSRREDSSQRRPASSPLSLSGDSGQGLRPRLALSPGGPGKGALDCRARLPTKRAKTVLGPPRTEALGDPD